MRTVKSYFNNNNKKLETESAESHTRRGRSDGSSASCRGGGSNEGTETVVAVVWKWSFPGGNDNYLTITGPSHPFLSGAEVSKSCRRYGGGGVGGCWGRGGGVGWWGGERGRRGLVVGNPGPWLMFAEEWQLLPEPMRALGRAWEVVVIRRARPWKERTCLFQSDSGLESRMEFLFLWRRSN